MSSTLPAMQFVPHRPPLLLVDTVLAHNACSITAELTVRDTAPFGDGDGGVPAYVGLEYMAQTIAALSGLRRSRQGLTPTIALLVGTRRYQASAPRFTDGELLTVTAHERISDYGDMSVFECRIANTAGQIVAEADVKAYQPTDIDHYLQAHP